MVLAYACSTENPGDEFGIHVLGHFRKFSVPHPDDPAIGVVVGLTVVRFGGTRVLRNHEVILGDEAMHGARNALFQFAEQRAKQLLLQFCFALKCARERR